MSALPDLFEIADALSEKWPSLAVAVREAARESVSAARTSRELVDLARLLLTPGALLNHDLHSFAHDLIQPEDDPRYDGGGPFGRDAGWL